MYGVMLISASVQIKASIVRGKNNMWHGQDILI